MLSDSTPRDLDSQAQAYVALALSLDRIKQGEVDSYFGPGNISSSEEITLDTLRERAGLLKDAVSAFVAPEGVEFDADRERQSRLAQRLDHLLALSDTLADPDAFSFADESLLLYGIELPAIPEIYQAGLESAAVTVDEREVTAEESRLETLAQLDDLLTGRGSLSFRLATYRAGLLVPVEKRQVVFERALEACREQTREHWSLPENENLILEWTRDVDAAWHNYEGEGQSVLRINPLSLAYIGSALDVACHEGYPGHHTQYLLLEQQAAPEGFLIEDSLVLLRSPESILREAAAEYGVSLAFPLEERLVFERDVLFPLAGLPPAEAERYVTIHQLMNRLAVATVPVIHAYAEGSLPRAAAIVKLERDYLVSNPAGLLEFLDEFGAYSVGYTLGRQFISQYIDTQATETSDDTWRILKDILEVPATETDNLLQIMAQAQ